MGKPWRNGGFIGFSCGFMGVYGIHPLENLYITMDNQTENCRLMVVPDGFMGFVRFILS